MTALNFVKCECGIEFRIVNARDGKRQTLTCECEREIEIVGSVTSIHAGKSGPTSSEQDWFKVSQEKIQILD